MLKRWKKKMFGEGQGETLSPQSNAFQPHNVIQFLQAKLAEDQLTKKAKSNIEKFEGLPAPKQLEELPAIYLFIEQLLAEVGKQRIERSELRREIRLRFGPMLENPRFGVIFETEDRQQRILCQMLLKGIVQQGTKLMGAAGQRSWKNLDEWLNDVPGTPHSPPFDELRGIQNPDSDGEWVETLREVALLLHRKFEENMGETIPSRIFEQNYQAMSNSYRSLLNFPVVVAMLPDKLIDEEKLQILSHGQLRQVLFGKVDSLQAINAKLNRKNRDLEEARVELEKARKEKADTARRLDSVLQTVGEAIVVINDEGTMLMVNQAVSSIWGYTEDELVGNEVTLLMHDRYHSLHRNGMQRYIQTGERRALNTRMELFGLRKTGEEFPLEIYISETQIGGNQFFTAALRDITKRKEQEERQQQLLAELKGANTDLRQYAHIVSHDLKAPLRGIGALAQWITVDYADLLDEQGKSNLKQLNRRVERMYSLIDGILEYSKIGKDTDAQKSCDLNETLGIVIDLLAPDSAVTVAIPNNLPIIPYSQVRVQQVFQNLIGNAIRYNDKEDPRVEISFVEEENYWRFCVSDNGPGIDEKYFEKVFEMFQTLEIRSHRESSGIGLAVVKKIVELYRGAIWIESIPNKGSDFIFTFRKENALP